MNIQNNMMEQQKTKKLRTTFTRHVGLPGLIILIVLSIYSGLFPTQAESTLNVVQNYMYQNLSWVYVLLITSFMVFLFLLACSKAGNIRLGADNSEPQYGFFSWISMLFAAGMGIGLMYYGVAEPMAHYVDPALADSLVPEKEAQLHTFFHWGLHAWAVYAVVGLVLAYFSYRYKLPLAIRSGLYPILKDKINGPIGDIVDIFALVSTFFGIATSLGLGAMQLNAGLSYLGLVQEQSFSWQVVLVIVVSSIAVGSTLLGMNKGVKRLSELNLVLAVLLLIFVLALGPTIFLLSAFSEGIGHYFSQFANLTFNTFAFEPKQQEWFTNWTVMFWAWWISWSPFVGLFIARISKGRTIREYILGVLLVPSLFIFFWMTVFGNGAIWFDQNLVNGALSAIANNPDVLLFKFLEQFPLSELLCGLGIAMIAVFFVTSCDSGILVMNSISTKNRPNTPRWQNVFWGALLCILSLLLLRTGGLKALQTMTLISAFPFGIVIAILCFCLVKAIRLDSRYRSTKLPYGSRNWDGEHWRQRLDQILTYSQKKDVKQFMINKVRPAFEDIQAALQPKGIYAEIRESMEGKMKIELMIPHNKISNFVYGVMPEKQNISDYFIDDDNTPTIETINMYVPVTYYNDGRRGNDIQYLTKEEIIADVLREYERFSSVIRNEQNEILIIDRNHLR